MSIVVRKIFHEEAPVPRKFQSILETVGNTPVVRINRLAPPGINLFVKICLLYTSPSPRDRS